MTDTSDFILGQLVALKKLGYPHHKVSELLTDWGYEISHKSISNHWNRFINKQKQSRRYNSGRKKKVDQDNVNQINNEVKNDRFLTAVDVTKDRNLNSQGLSSSTIQRILYDEGLYAFRPAIITSITLQNKQKSNLRKKWE